MKKKVLSLFVGLVILIGAYVGFESRRTFHEFSSVVAQEQNSRGNTVGNIVNLGLVTQQGNWIYYSSSNDHGKLYKIRTDGTGRTKLNDESSLSINVIGDWIYYSNTFDSKIYKIRTNGTERIKLNEDCSDYLNVIGDWIYYRNCNDVFNIYKIRTDGSSRTELSKEGCHGLNVVGEWIYYINWNDRNKIYKVRTDGTERKKLNEDSSESINVVDRWIYYTNLNHLGFIYKVRIDGMEHTRLNESESRDLNVVRDWIYFSNHSDEKKIYKVRIDGTGNTKLNDDNSWNPNVTNEWIYYINGSDRNQLYKIRTDGKDKSPMEDQSVSTLRDVNVVVNPNIVGSVTSYAISFTLGSRGAINAVQDTISITFPSDTVLPATISANSITVNGTPLQVRPQIDITQRKMTLPLPVRIDNDGYGVIDISPSANVKNPTKPGNYQISLQTSKELDPVMSNYYSIQEDNQIATIQIDPTTATLYVGESISFTATARNAQNQVIPNVSFTWAVAPSDLGTINSSGLFKATKKGTGVIIVSAGGEQAQASITVLENISRIEINPSNARLNLNDSVQFYATVYDASNVPISTPVSWEVTGGIGTTTPSGLFKATRIGTGKIIATAGTVMASANIEVKEDTSHIVATIQIDPTTATLYVGESMSFTATARNAQNQVIPNVSFTWAVAPTELGTLSSNGHFTAGRKGEGILTVRANNVQASVAVTVIDRKKEELKITIVTPKSLDQVLPVLVPSNVTGSYQLMATINLEGSIYPARNSTLKIISPNKMKTPLTLSVASNGSFKGEVKIPVIAGLNGITISVWDADNAKDASISIPIVCKIELGLQIDSKLAFMNYLEYRLEAAPYIRNGRTMLPMRFIGEAFGAEITWNAQQRKVGYYLDNVTVELTLGSTITTVKRGGKTEQHRLDVAPEIVNGRTFVPVRFIAEMFGAQIKWDHVTKSIDILK